MSKMFIEECVAETMENVDIKNHYWQCTNCMETERGLEEMISQWRELRGDITDIRKRVTNQEQHQCTQRNWGWAELVQQEEEQCKDAGPGEGEFRIEETSGGFPK